MRVIQPNNIQGHADIYLLKQKGEHKMPHKQTQNDVCGKQWKTRCIF